MNNDVSIVILNYNDSITTIGLYNAIKEYKNINHIIIVDNCSTDDSFSKIQRSINNKCDLIITDSNKGYSYGNNWGVKYAIDKYESEFVIIANPDIMFEDAIITKMVSYMNENKNIGVLAPQMKNIDMTNNSHCAWKVPTLSQYVRTALLFNIGNKNTYYYKEIIGSEKKVGCVAGSFFIIRTKAFKDIGYFDENVFLYCEETILGIKMQKKGYDTYILPNIFFVHAHSVSINNSIKSEYKKDKLLLRSRIYVLKNYYDCANMKLLLIKLLLYIDINIRRLNRILFRNK